jgi:protein required for attachment to host cells
MRAVAIFAGMVLGCSGHATQLAAMLEDGLNQGRFDCLVLVAPPRALGQLRDELSESVHDKISAELAKDLTQTPQHKLPEHLVGIMAV